MNPLSSFSEWTLALLPRLFLYPGGVYLLFALALFSLFRQPRDFTLRGMMAALVGTPLLPLAASWAAVAIMPLPWSAPLPFAADTFALLFLPIVSLGLDEKVSIREMGTTIAILVVALTTTLHEQRLLTTGMPFSISSLLGLGAAIVGLAVLGTEIGRSLSRAGRWVTLWALVFSLGVGQERVLSLPILPVILLAGIFLQKRGWLIKGEYAAYALAALSLFTALLRLPV